MSGERTIILAGAALLGRDLHLIEDAALVLEGSRIVEGGDAASIDPGDATVVDARSLTLLPGFIDAHVHIAFYPPANVVAGGVTTVRDLAWPPEDIHPLTARSNGDDFDGPLILAAGPMLTAPGGYPTQAEWAPPGTGRIVAGPDEAEEQVARTALEGACVIKLGMNAAAGPTMDEETLRAVVGAAHARDLKVTAHVTGMAELEKALSVGIDEMAHMLMSEEIIPGHLIEAMVRRDITIVPTLSVRFDRDRGIAIDNTARFVQAGGRIIYGTDLGNSGPRPGIDKREIEAMVAAGISSHSLVRSATVAAAEWLGLRSTGALEPGYIADVIGVHGEPLRDALALTEVALVYRGGRRVR